MLNTYPEFTFYTSYRKSVAMCVYYHEMLAISMFFSAYVSCDFFMQ